MGNELLDGTRPQNLALEWSNSPDFFFQEVASSNLRLESGFVASPRPCRQTLEQCLIL